MILFYAEFRPKGKPTPGARGDLRAPQPEGEGGWVLPVGNVVDGRTAASAKKELELRHGAKSRKETP